MKYSTILLGPSLDAVSGVSTHLRHLFCSPLADHFNLHHFQVGSEGRNETVLGKLVRIFCSPFCFFLILARKRAKIVHINTSMVAKAFWRDILYLSVAKVMRKKVVFQIHGGQRPQDFCGRNLILKFALKRVLGSADVIVLLASREVVDYSSFMKEVNIALIPNAVEAGPEPNRANDGINVEALRLVYVGRIDEQKGVFSLLEAVKILHRAGKKVSLNIAGNGKDEIKLVNRIADYKISENVKFLGPVYGDAKDRLWRNSDLFVCPTFSEGLPYALLESMAAGVPALISPVGAIPDVVLDKVNGYFISENNAEAIARDIINLEGNRSFVKAMGCAARRRVLDFYTVRRMSEDFIEIYRRLSLELER